MHLDPPCLIVVVVVVVAQRWQGWGRGEGRHKNLRTPGTGGVQVQGGGASPKRRGGLDGYDRSRGGERGSLPSTPPSNTLPAERVGGGWISRICPQPATDVNVNIIVVVVGIERCDEAAPPIFGSTISGVVARSTNTLLRMDTEGIMERSRRSRRRIRWKRG